MECEFQLRHAAAHREASLRPRRIVRVHLARANRSALRHEPPRTPTRTSHNHVHDNMQNHPLIIGHETAL